MAINNGLTPFSQNYKDTYLADPSETTKPKEKNKNIYHSHGNSDLWYRDNVTPDAPQIRNWELDPEWTSRLYEEAVSDFADKYNSYRDKRDDFKKLSEDELRDLVKEYVGYRLAANPNLEGMSDAVKQGFATDNILKNMSYKSREKNNRYVFYGFEDYILNNRANNKKEQDDGENAEIIEFTYNPGDTFGQKIIDSGLATDNGLWGDEGDVAYYNRQLRDGGYLDDYGNIRLGMPIRLAKRK